LNTNLSLSPIGQNGSRKHSSTPPNSKIDPLVGDYTIQTMCPSKVASNYLNQTSSFFSLLATHAIRKWDMYWFRLMPSNLLKVDNGTTLALALVV